MKKKKVSLEILNSRELSQEQMKTTFGGYRCTPECTCYGIGCDSATPTEKLGDIATGQTW